LNIFITFVRKNTKKLMATIDIKDKTFETLIPEEEILRRVKVVADKISNDLKGKNPLLLGVLNGSFIFAADLMRMLTIESEISFVKMSSYEGTESTGNVKKLVGLNENIEGRTVVIVEDIVDSGLTMERMLEYLKDFKPAEIRICTLLLKPENLKRKLDIDYVAMEIPNDFIVGYGLDYDGLGRNLRDIYVVK
jgi:hypoxanthine phosphoribosyltransferase